MRLSTATRCFAWIASAVIPVTLVAGPLTGSAIAAQPARAQIPATSVTPTDSSKGLQGHVTDSPSLTFTWQPITGESYSCSVDGAKPVSCSGQYATPNLADGSHFFTNKIRQTGHRPNTYTFAWTLRSGAPTQPQDVAIVGSSPTKNNSMTITWTDSDPTAASYQCELDKDGVVAQKMAPCGTNNAKFGTTEFYNLSDDGANGAASYVAKVWAFNSFGNPQNPSSVSPGSVGWQVDQNAPSQPVFDSGSLPAKFTNVNTADFTWTDVDYGNGGPITSFVCLLDNTAVTPCSATGTKFAVGAGTHTFSVEGIDAAGNVGVPANYSWTVLTSPPPAPTINNGPARPVTDVANATFFFSDEQPHVFYDCSLDSSDLSKFTRCTSPTSYSGLADGAHQFFVRAEDAAGNLSDATEYDWSIDTSPTSPVIVSAPQFTGYPAGFSNDTDPGFTWIDIDANTDHDECSLNGGGWATCTSGDKFAVSGDGVKTLSVRSADAPVGSSPNYSPASTWTWTLDTTPPTPPVFSTTPANPSHSSGAVFAFASDRFVEFTCALDGGKATVCASPITYQGLADGSHSFVVTATDAAGNSSHSTYTWVIQTAPATQPGAGNPDTTAPTASINVPGSLTGSAVVTFSEQVQGLAANSVVYGVTGTTAVLPATTVCLANGLPTSCSGTFTAVRLSPKAPFVPGQHYTVAVHAGAAHDPSGNPSGAASAAFRALRTIEESSVAVHAAWPTVKAKTALGGSYVREHLRGAAASWSFVGSSVTWWTVTGPDQGNAAVYVDGVKKATFNNYAAKAHARVGRTVKGLKKGLHVIRIQVLGTKSAKSRGTFVGVDGFTVGKAVTKTPKLTMALRGVTGSHYLASHAAVADVAGEAVTMTFRGTAITWSTVRGVNQGKAAVYVDGVLKATFDNYASKTAYGVKRTVAHLSDKVHTLKVVVLGKHHKGAKGNLVTVDRFTIA